MYEKKSLNDVKCLLRLILLSLSLLNSMKNIFGV